MQRTFDIDHRRVRVEVDGEPRWGRRDGDAIVLDDGTRLDEADASYLAPVEPTKILAVHLTYRSRVEEYAARMPAEPSYFVKPPTTLNGHRRSIPMATWRCRLGMLVPIRKMLIPRHRRLYESIGAGSSPHVRTGRVKGRGA